MSISAVGNVVFVNQQTASVSPLQGNQNTRFDLQNVAAQAAINEKEKEILDVRPSEENHKTDEDREHQRQDADEETKRTPMKNEHEETEEEREHPLHTLDIKV
jgi:Tfp pilus assembly protein PilX